MPMMIPGAEFTATNAAMTASRSASARADAGRANTDGPGEATNPSAFDAMLGLATPAQPQPQTQNQTQTQTQTQTVGHTAMDGEAGASADDQTPGMITGTPHVAAGSEKGAGNMPPPAGGPAAALAPAADAPAAPGAPAKPGCHACDRRGRDPVSRTQRRRQYGRP